MGILILLLIVYIMVLHIKLSSQNKSSSSQPIIINNYPNSTNTTPPDNSQSTKISSLPQSSFFIDSINFAKNFLNKKSNFNNEIPLTASAQKTLNTASLLNDNIKSDIIKVMNTMANDNSEFRLRMISQQEQTPLWIIILRESMMKTSPSMNLNNTAFNPNSISQSDQSSNVMINENWRNKLN